MKNLEDTQPQAEGDANAAGGEDTSQVIKAEGGSTIQNVIQAVIHLSPWAWVVSTVILAVAALLVAGLFNIGPLRALLPTPMAFEPAGEGESLIIVADFDNRSGGKYQGMDPAQYIYEKLLAQAEKDGLDVRIERLREVVDDNTARPVGEAYNATLVLWGWYDALTITPRLERIKTLKGYFSTEKGLHFSLADPEKVEFSILTDLPSQATYLMFFILGMDQYSREKLDQAMLYLTSALNAISEMHSHFIDPSDAYFLRGIVSFKQADYLTALEDNTHALRLKPVFGEAYFNRGLTHWYLDNFEEALSDFDNALLLNPTFAGTYINRGITYGAMGNYEAALADFDHGLMLDPENPLICANRGVAYMSMGSYEVALADFNRALELNPEFAEVYYNRGQCYLQLGEYAEALENYNQALELKPDYALAYNNRGVAYYEIGDYEAALANYIRALELNPDLLIAYNNRGLAYHGLGEYEAALADYDHVLRLNPDDASACFNRALTHRQLDRIENAIADFERVLELNPLDYWKQRAEQHLRELRGE